MSGSLPLKMKLIEKTLEEVKEIFEDIFVHKNTKRATYEEVSAEAKSCEDGEAEKDILKRMNVPGDGSCLFWAVAMAYLFPVRNNPTLFSERFDKLFRLQITSEMVHVRKLLQNNSLEDAYDDDVFFELVTNRFRNRIINKMLFRFHAFHQSVTLDDFLYMKNEAFIVDGAFRERVLTQFPSESHLIDLNRLKPDRLDTKTIELMNEELDKISEKKKVQKFKFRTYLESMRNRKCWAGPLEIKAIQLLFKCKILLINDEQFKYSMIKNGTNIFLFLTNENHYNFGLVKPEAVIKAIKNVNYRLASRLIKIGVDNVNYQDDIGWTVLHYATTTDNHDDLISHLVNQGASLDIKNKDDKTALELARLLDQKKSIRVLTDLAQGVIAFDETEIEQESFKDVLKQFVIINKSFKLYDNLVEKYIVKNNNPIEHYDPRTLVHAAAQMGNVDEVRMMVKFREVDVRDSLKRTPLQKAADYGHINVVKFLIEHGADVNSVDAEQVSVLTSAVVAGHDHIVDYLMVKGAEVNSLDKNRMSPLHHAVQREQWNMVNCLVEHKAHLKMVNDEGETPLSMTIERGNWDIARYLLENGALLVGLAEETKRDIYHRFIANLDANKIHHAIALGNVELLEMLITSVPIEDETLIEVYNELKVQNVRLSSDICVFIENKLMDVNYYSDSKLTDEPNKETLNIDNIKKRLRLLIGCIDQLLIDYSKDKEVSDSFVFIGKFVAKNMQILKRDLSVTRDVIPWEEMQFCLINFLFRFIEPNKIDSTMTLVLNKSRLIRHLSLFKSQLEKLDINKLDFSKKLIKQRNLFRGSLNSLVPELKDLFDDFEQLRDLHSLIKMEFHLKVACSVDFSKEPEVSQLVIERALQVTGECLKNTAESPNLSDKMQEEIFNIAVMNAKNIIVTLRDVLSHVETLTKRVKMESRKRKKYLKKIKNDLMNFTPEITIMLNSKKIDICKRFLKKTIDCETVEAIEDIVLNVEIDDTLKSNVREGTYVVFKTIAIQFAELRRLSEKSADFPTEFLDQFDKIIIEILNKNRKIQKTHANILVKINKVFKLFKSNKDMTSFKESIRFILAKYPFNRTDYDETYYSIWRLNMLFADFFPKLLVSPELATVLRKLFHIINHETKKVNAIEEFKLNLKEKKTNERNLDLLISTIDEQLFYCLGKISDIYLINEIRGEYEAKKDIFRTKIKLIKFYERIIELEEGEFSAALSKINFRLLKKQDETSSILFNETDKSKCKKIVERTKRTNDPFGRLVKTLTEKPDSDVALETNKFFESLKSVKNIVQCSNLEHKKRIKDSLSKLYFQKLKTLNNILDLNQRESELIDRLRSNAELRLAVEMLVLTLTEILDNVSVFQTNRTFLDDSIPVLIGKHLRNYLAHGDLLIDLLSIDHLKSIVYHIRNMQKNSSETESIVSKGDYRIGKTRMEDIDKLEIDYQQNLELISKREKLFIDIKQSDLSLTKTLTLSSLELKYRNCNGWTLLYHVAQTDHLDLFKVILNDHLNIYYRDKFGQSILYYLVKFNSVSILKYLIDHYNIDPNVVLRKRQSMLHVSAEFGHLELTQWLLSIGVNIDDTDEYGFSPIHHAALNQHFAVVSMLIEHNAQIITEDSSINQMICVISNKITLQHLMNTKTDLKLFFLAACASGYLDTVKFWLENSIDVNAESKVGLTALHLATKYSQSEVVKLLLDNKADVNRVTKDGKTALHTASSRNNLDIVKLLIERGADVNAKTEKGFTPLLIASIAGNSDVALLLLTKGADISFLFKGHSALYHAAYSNHTDTFKLLLDHYSDVKIMNKDVGNCLHIASARGNVQIIDKLLKRGLDINFLRENKATPLLSAIANNKKPLVEMLLERGADANASNDYGMTPLHIVAVSGHLGILNLLMDKHAEFKKDAFKNTPLHQALLIGNELVAKALIKKYPDRIDERNSTMATALHIASRLGNFRVMDMLLKYKTDVTLTDKDNKTPLFYAACNGYLKIVEKLVERDTQLIFGSGNSNLPPLHVAALNGHVDVIKLLLKLNKHIVNIKDAIFNSTALHMASLSSHFGAARVLLDNGADVNSRSKYNATPLHLALKSGNCRLVKLLLDEGAEINAIMIDNYNSLYLAVSYGHHQMVKLLIERRVNLNARESLPYRSFFGAIQVGHVAIVNTLIHHGADVNAFCKDLTPLHVAVRCGHEVVALVLLKHGANAYALDELNRGTPMHMAAGYGRHEMVKVFQRRKVDKNIHDMHGLTPLEIAIKHGHAKCVIYLLIFEAGINSVAKNKNFISFLLLSLLNGNSEVVRVVLNHQCAIDFADETDDKSHTRSKFYALKNDVDILKLLLKRETDMDGQDLLLWAAKEGKAFAIELLLHCKDIDINKHGLEGWTPLQLAVYGGHFEVAETLIQNGADVFAMSDHYSVLQLALLVNKEILRLIIKEMKMKRHGEELRLVMNAADGKGITPLIRATLMGNVNAIKILVQCENVDINCRGLKGFTALHLAVHRGHFEAMEMLIENGADVFAKNDHHTVLHQAVKNDDILRLVMRVMRMRRDGEGLRSALNAGDIEGDTPLMWAVENGRLSAAELLLESDEIEVNKQNDKGWTALHWSAHVGHSEIVNLLIDNKADAEIRDANGETAFDIAYKNESSDEKFKIVAALILSVTDEV